VSENNRTRSECQFELCSSCSSSGAVVAWLLRYFAFVNAL